MDPLDDLFAAMRVRSALYARIEAAAPWGLDFAEGVSARFGLIVHGRCWLTVAARNPVVLSEGDCFVLAHGTRYTLQDEPCSPMRLCSEAVRDHVGGTVNVGGCGEPASIITGWFTFDEIGARPLIDLLPLTLLTRIDQERTELLPALLQLLNVETEAPGLGSSIVVSRLADIVFVEALRAHAAAEGNSGWLAGLSDRQIGPALKALHASLERAWTIDGLAKVAGMSRSAFAARFKDRIGQPPLAYLTRWRMFRAGSLLRHSDGAIAEISDSIGYKSEAAFNKAFKREMGMTPAQYRREKRLASSVTQHPSAGDSLA